MNHLVPFETLNVVLLAGGVGGAKLAYGLSRILPPEKLTIIGNTGDDFEHFGLWISPDLDTVMYTLAELVNPETGWGRIDETWRAMEGVGKLGGADWFNLGDTDLATHLVRTQWLKEGRTLTDITADLCAKFGVPWRLLPMANMPAPTTIETDAGVLPFQEWFVQQKWQPTVKSVQLPDEARTTPQVMAALRDADLVVIAPSNPYVSVDPILNAYPIRPILADLPVAIIGVTPIVGGDAVKGPTAKMMREWALPISPATVAEHFADLLSGFIYDGRDPNSLDALNERGLYTLETDTWMKTAADKIRFAKETLTFGMQVRASIRA